MKSESFEVLCREQFGTNCACARKLSVKENKSGYILDNDLGLQVCKLEIDGNVIRSEADCKCDWGVLFACRNEKKSVWHNCCILVELKGRNFVHALEQIAATLENEEFKRKCERFGFRKRYVRIVCSKINKAELNSSRSKKLKMVLKSSYGLNPNDIVSKSIKLEEKISGFFDDKGELK